MGAKRSIHGMFAGSILSAYLLTSLVAMGCDDDKSADMGADHADDHEHSGTAGGEAEHGDHDPSVMIGPLTGATCPEGSTLTYANFGKAFFKDYCLRCHSVNVKGDARMMAPADHNFDELSEIDLLSPHIDQKAGSGPKATNEAMPKSDPKPTLEERKKLSEWIACGVKE